MIRKFIAPRIFELALLILVVAGMTSFAMAWGPHPQITRAGAEVLSDDEPVLRLLSNDLGALGNASWMPDLTHTDQILHVGGARCWARDYVFMPGFDSVGHCYPGVTKSYEPIFRRTVQALRTETPSNVLGWLGSLIHFTEDTGAPPHAIKGSGGRYHGIMENYVDAKQVKIPGYKPRLLGSNEEEALAGFVKRMQELREFSIPRGKKLLPLAEKDDRAAMEPIELESALESARAVADVLHTLSAVGWKPLADHSGLQGSIAGAKTSADQEMVAKVMLLGTRYSTLADPKGRYSFRNLPPGEYEVAVVGPGFRPAKAKVTVKANSTASLNIEPIISNPSGNLLRYNDFSVDWNTPKQPDGWRRLRCIPPTTGGQKPGMGWCSERVMIKPGTKYQLSAEWKEKAQGKVAVVWFPADAKQKPRLSAALSVGDKSIVVESPQQCKRAAVVLYPPVADPDVALKYISLAPLQAARNNLKAQTTNLIPHTLKHKGTRMKFDHVGLITTEKKADEMFVEATRVWVTNFQGHPYKIEWLRFEDDSPLTGPVRNNPHVAFSVDNIEEASQGMKVLIEPFDAGPATVGFYESEDGAVVEFMKYKKENSKWQASEK